MEQIQSLWGAYSPEPRTEVYFVRLNFNMSKLGYYVSFKLFLPQKAWEKVVKSLYFSLAEYQT